MLIVLTALLIAATAHLGPQAALSLLLLCLGFTMLSDLLCTFVKVRKFIFPHSAIVTGLILTLIIDPQATWYQIAVIAAAAMAIKNFLRPARRHIFNPAASGLAVGWLLFGIYPSWWAPTPYGGNMLSPENIVIFAVVLCAAYVSCYRLARYRTVVAYLIAYVIFLQLFGQSASFTTSVAAILNPGTLFYALVMLVEPMTCPNSKISQLLYGTFVAATTVLLVFIGGKVSFPLFDASLTALLLGNLLFFKFR